MFIRSHMDVFMAILKDGRSLISMGILQELSLITAVIGHCKAGATTVVISHYSISYVSRNDKNNMYCMSYCVLLCT